MARWFRKLLPALLIVTALSASRADEQPQPPPGDGLSQGLWWLYQLQYERAYRVLSQYVDEHPTDPAGYFYKTAVDWWQLAQEFDYKLPAIETRLDDDYHQTLTVSKNAATVAKTDHERGLAQLYWGGAEGLEGRWLVTQAQWVDAYFRGRAGAKHLRRAIAYDPTLYDAYMGIGIYDYFSDTLSGVQAVLSALLIHGDRQRGLKEIQLAIEKSPRARVESMIFLTEIYTSEENQPEKALPLTQALRAEFPYSPAMQLAEIMCYYSLRQWDEVTKESEIFLKRSREETPYFTHKGIQPALYCLGVAALMGRHDSDECMRYMTEILSGRIDSSRWISFAYLRRGEVYDLKGQRDLAIADYKAVLSRADFWGSHKEAAQHLKDPYTDH